MNVRKTVPKRRGGLSDPDELASSIHKERGEDGRVCRRVARRRRPALGKNATTTQASPAAKSRREDEGARRSGRTAKPAPTKSEATSKAGSAKRVQPGFVPAEVPDDGTELEELAEQIRQSNNQLNQTYRTSLRQAFEVGKYLLRVKELLGHGRFMKWLKKNFTEIKARTARTYMQVASDDDLRQRLDDPNWQPDADLTLKSYLKKGKAKHRPKPAPDQAHDRSPVRPRRWTPR